jgi:hypothetical protein
LGQLTNNEEQVTKRLQRFYPCQLVSFDALTARSLTATSRRPVDLARPGRSIQLVSISDFRFSYSAHAPLLLENRAPATFRLSAVSFQFFLSTSSFFILPSTFPCLGAALHPPPRAPRHGRLRPAFFGRYFE